MKNIKIIVLITFILFQSCENEIQKKKSVASEKVQQRESLCYINKIQKIDGKISAEIDFIEYSKTTDLDSTILSSNIIELPNGFSYSNKDVKIEAAELALNAKIIFQTFSYNKDGSFNFNQEVTIDELIKEFNTSEQKPFKFSPFKIVQNGSAIISLTEIYIP